MNTKKKIILLNSIPHEQESNIPIGRTQEEFRSSNKIHSRAKEASTFIKRRIDSAREKQQGQLSTHEAEDIERVAAFDFAVARNVWINDFYSLGYPLKGGGNENTLAYDEKKGIIYKSNNLFNYQNSIINFLDGILAHNKLFPETKYDLVGFTGIVNTVSQVPYIEPVLKQDYVPYTEQASVLVIDYFMKSLGFEKIKEYSFRNNQYTISDLRPRNVLQDKFGNIYVVDNIILSSYPV